MKLLDLSPYVLPHVGGCPYPTLEHHIRLAAIEFCRRTLCYTRTLDPVPTDGSDLLELEPFPHTQIVKIKAVDLGGQGIELVPSHRGMALLRAGHAGPFCFTQDDATLRLIPAPKAGTSCTVDAALAPTITAKDIDNALAAEHMQDIAHGAIASIKRVTGQEFTDLQGSMLFEQMFRTRIATIAAKQARGVAAGKMPSYREFT